MIKHTIVGVMLLGALACDAIDESDAVNMAGASATDHAGAAGARLDGTVAGASGTAENDGGGAGEAAVPDMLVPKAFWNDDVQHIEFDCFGFFAGFARLRADRAQLSAQQVQLLANARGTPGDVYDGNDDDIHCVISTTDSAGKIRKYTEANGSLFTTQQTEDDTLQAVLGCEFRHPVPSNAGGGAQVHLAIAANELCLHKVWPGTAPFLDLPTPGRTYRVEMIDCAKPAVEYGMQLFGTDPTTPLAVATVPSEPGPDKSCLVLDAEVEAPVVGHLDITATQFADEAWLTFR